MNPITLPTRIMKIVEAVAEEHDVTVGQLLGQSRQRKHVRARWAVWAILDAEGKSLTQIGNYFNRDHTTILHGLGRLSRQRTKVAA